MHGASAPQVKQAARLRLAAMVDPSLDIILKHLKPGRGKYVKPELQVKCALDVLDRNGFKSRDEVIITQQLEPTQYSHLAEGELEVLIRMLRSISMPVDQHDRPADIEIRALAATPDPPNP